MNVTINIVYDCACTYAVMHTKFQKLWKYVNKIYYTKILKLYSNSQINVYFENRNKKSYKITHTIMYIIFEEFMQNTFYINVSYYSIIS